MTKESAVLSGVAIGDGSDLTDAGRSRTITCDPNDHTWKPAPANCYGWLIDGIQLQHKMTDTNLTKSLKNEEDDGSS